MNIFLVLGLVFILIFILGNLLEKIRVPWLFAALIIGLAFSWNKQLIQVSNSSIFTFLANLGMYFLLFLIGFELNLEKIKKLGNFIIRSTFSIILFEALLGSLLIHFVFNYSWLISIIVSVSFATVGEALLLPILDEFKLTSSKLGQSILSIGTLDDLIEVFIMIALIILLPILEKSSGSIDLHRILYLFLTLLLLFTISFVLINLKKLKKLKESDNNITLLLSLALFFIFLGISGLQGELLTALGAILAGITVSNILPEKQKPEIEKGVKYLTFSLFAPIFFLWVGTDTSLSYLFSSPLLILLVIVVTATAKILASFIMARKKLGKKESITMGIALGVRFSTSIVIIKILFENKIIHDPLYSILIGSTIIFTFFIPFVLSSLIRRWNISSNKA